jgi:hypothetical protein
MMPKNKTVQKGEIAKEKKQRGTRLTLADKIVGDQELQMLVNSGAHDKLQKLGRQSENLATQASNPNSSQAKEKRTN